MNMEARGEQATLLNRKCVFIRWRDLDLEKFLELIERGAGALVILLPSEMGKIKDNVLEVILCVLRSWLNRALSLARLLSDLSVFHEKEREDITSEF